MTDTKMNIAINPTYSSPLKKSIFNIFDAITSALMVMSLIGVGAYLDSIIMEIVGALLAFVIIHTAFKDTFHRFDSKEEAIEFLQNNVQNRA